MVSGARYRRAKIEIDTDGPSAKSSQMTERLERIDRNYDKLAQILDELEEKIAMDERLGEDTEARHSSSSPAYRPRQPR